MLAPYWLARVTFPGLSEEDKVVRKVRFCTEAVSSRDRFQKGIVFDDDLRDAIEWIAGHSAEEVRELSPVAAQVRMCSACRSTATDWIAWRAWKPSASTCGNQDSAVSGCGGPIR